MQSLIPASSGNQPIGIAAIVFYTQAPAKRIKGYPALPHLPLNFVKWRLLFVVKKDIQKKFKIRKAAFSRFEQ